MTLRSLRSVAKSDAVRDPTKISISPVTASAPGTQAADDRGATPGSPRRTHADLSTSLGLSDWPPTSIVNRCNGVHDSVAPEEESIPESPDRSPQKGTEVLPLRGAAARFEMQHPNVQAMICSDLEDCGICGICGFARR